MDGPAAIDDSDTFDIRREVEADRKASRRADLMLMILGLVLLVPAVLWFAWMSAWLGAVTGQCGGANVCNDDAISAGRVIAGLGPLVVWVLTAAVSIVRFVRGRTAWWIPPIGFLVAWGVLWTGAEIAHWGANLR